MDCKICNSGPIGSKWTAELNLNIRKPKDAALFFQISIDDVLEHLNSHKMEYEDVNLAELLDDPNFFYQELLMIHIKLKDWLSFIIESEDLSPSTINTLTKLVKENRDTLKLIAELQGKLNRGNTYQNQFIQIQGDFQMFTSSVLENTCPACQQKLFQVMKDKQLQLTGNKPGKR